MKIALVHDRINKVGGDIRVLDALRKMYPAAPVYGLPNSKMLLPFFPSMIESLDLSEHDVVISTGSIFSKGLVLRPKTYHINYCHSPARQVWDLSHEYRHKIFQHALRIWDRNASTRVDKFIANSEHVKKRIKKYYRREAEVIYPPVAIATPPSPPPGGGREEFLIVSRLFKHKNIDIAIRAFNKLGWELNIIGDGPERARLEALAGPTVHLLGSLPDALLTTHYSLCTAFILPQEEDFGIAPVEAMMHGKPVLALRAGGALEYVQEGINGIFFDEPHEAVLADGVRRLAEQIDNFNPAIIKRSVEKFSVRHFQQQFGKIINYQF